jgi:hypothetical protein
LFHGEGTALLAPAAGATPKAITAAAITARTQFGEVFVGEIFIATSSGRPVRQLTPKTHGRLLILHPH